MKNPTEKQLYAFCKSHFYSYLKENGDDEDLLWQPFEDWDTESVEEQIQNMMGSITTFFKLDRKPRKKRVTIDVNGGVAYVNWDKTSKGVNVQIIDHD